MKRFIFLIGLFLMFSINIFAQKIDVEDVENLVFAVVEDMPSFPTCSEDKDRKCTEAEVKAFIKENLQYPDYAYKNGVEGVCVISCIVEKDGSFSDFKIARNIGAGTGEEALRIMKLLPNFQTGKQRGEAVRVQMNFPVRFEITSDTKAKVKARRKAEKAKRKAERKQKN
jgi:TonB family protein